MPYCVQVSGNISSVAVSEVAAAQGVPVQQVNDVLFRQSALHA